MRRSRRRSRIARRVHIDVEDVADQVARSASTDRPPSQDERTYPAGALAAMLVIGVVLGLLLAALISAFLGGGSSSGRPKRERVAVGPRVRLERAVRPRFHPAVRPIRANSAPETDVRVYACGVDADGYASARVLITNGGNDSATYHVRVISPRRPTATSSATTSRR